MGLKAITPKHKPFPNAGTVGNRVEVAMIGWGGRVTRALGTYPAQQPTKYTRSGKLGRNWAAGFHLERSGGALVGIAENKTSYGVHVQGPREGAKGERQAARMAAKGWSSISDVAKAQWAYTLREVRAAMEGK